DTENFYIAGYDNIEGNSQWRIEKRSLITGALVADFGTDGVVTMNPNEDGEDIPYFMTIDDDYIYVSGYDSSLGNDQWRIVKLDKLTGEQVDDFGRNGVVTSNPGEESDIPNSMAMDEGYLYLVGSDFSPGDNQWRIERRDKTTGDQ
ncbi:MAG: hypothetical protein KAS70_06640, partial [Planctomycetes bacterium]|nr:hypothetical protein [Planctomycetota bacterium]